MRQRPQYLLEAFASAGHPVYFVDPSEKLARVADGVTIVPSLSATPRTGVIIYAHFAPVRTMFDRFEDPVVVYDILDDLSIFDADEVGVPEERRVRSHHGPIMESSDVVIASAPLLVERHSPERPDIFCIENGVDADTFSDAKSVPSDMAGIDGPVVGYHGMVSRWFDFDLLETVANLQPSTSFVIVGPVAPESTKPADRLGALPNVHFLGPRPSDDMPSYVGAFDVGIVPFVVDEMTRAVSPLKMYEYLAAGVPVVATPLPVCVDHPLVETSADPDEFSRMITEALGTRDDPNAREQRVEAAREADWSARITPLRKQLDAIGRLRVPL
jgi:glycosyltransferase involved in cell wall biosynthesis